MEVDFVLYGEKGFFAFEIKSQTQLTAKAFKALKIFKEDYPMASCFMLYRGAREYFEEGIRVIPIDKALFMFRALLDSPGLGNSQA